MPYDYHLFLGKVNLNDSIKCFMSLTSFKLTSSNVRTTCLHVIDGFAIPLAIRTLAVFTRSVQVEFSKILDCLIESYSDILNTNALIKFFNKKQLLSQIYGSMKENCRIIQSLLADNRLDEATTWLTEHVNSHPYILLVKSIQTLNSELTDECKHNPELVKLVHETVGIYCSKRLTKNVGKNMVDLIHLRKLISEMIMYFNRRNSFSFRKYCYISKIN